MEYQKKEAAEVTVLLISDNATDINEVKKHLKKTMGIDCKILHCADITKSAVFFEKDIPEVNIVLLDIGQDVSENPRESFHQMLDIVGGIPIIVLTEREDH